MFSQCRWKHWGPGVDPSQFLDNQLAAEIVVNPGVRLLLLLAMLWESIYSAAEHQACRKPQQGPGKHSRPQHFCGPLWGKILEFF